MLACKAGHFSCTEFLLDHGASLFTLDNKGATALHYAALAPHGGCVQLLLRKAGLWGAKGPQPPEDQKLLMWVGAGWLLKRIERECQEDAEGVRKGRGRGGPQQP